MLLLAGGSSQAAGALIVKMPSRGSSARLARALARALDGGATKVVNLTGDGPADSARLARESHDAPVLYTIGPDATETAADTRGVSVVSLGVPNPARVRTPGTYVSIYPRLDRVFEYVKSRLGAAKVGLLFTPATNREIALGFLKQGESDGVGVVPIPVSSSGDLVRELRQALPKVDVVLLAVDPILFDRRSLEFITDETRSARKPTVGFLEELAGLGVTVCLVTPPDAAAAAAVEAAQEPVRLGKKRVEVDKTLVIVSRAAAKAVGLNPEALGAQQVR